MNINHVSSLLPNFLQPPAAAATNSVSSGTQPTGTAPSSSFLQELQQLQQQNPSEFTQIDTKIVSRLQQAAQQATANGDSTAANQLNALATQFQNAASGGQIPTAQQLQQAGLSGHHHCRGGHPNEGQQESILNALQTPVVAGDTQSLLASVMGSTSGLPTF